MATTELKTVEKLVKEVLDLVKGSKENDTKVTQELVKKVDKINTKIDKKAKDYVKELQKAFDTYQQKKIELLSESGITDSEDLKDFVKIITNEMYELKSQFEKFNEEFADLTISTAMTASKEIISMKNHVLSLNDSIDAINQYISNIDWQNLLVNPVSDSINEVFSAQLNVFKKSIFDIIAKIIDGTDNVIKKISENSTIVEGFENTLGEIRQTQQKNKDEIVKIINAQIEKNSENITKVIHDETNNLVPKMAQLIGAISFDENAEDIKETIKEETDNLVPKMAQLVGAISFDENAEDIKENIDNVNDNLEVVNKNVETTIATSGEILEKVTELKENINIDPEVTSNILEQVTNINNTVENNMLAKISKINTTLDTVTNDFNILTKGSKEDTEEYVYTLLDLESDISKVRILLDDLTRGIRNDKNLTEISTKEISDKIETISSHIKDTEDIFTAPDYQLLLSQFEALNDDITSISKRTNKLILTSDDSSVKLEKNIEDFQNILRKISLTVKDFDKSSVIKNISLRTDNIQKMLNVSLQSDKAINEAFIYLAGWVDETSAEIENIKMELSLLNTKIDTINEFSKLQQPTNNFDKLIEVVEAANKRMDKIEKEISNSNEIKSSIDFLVAQIQIANEKIAENKTLNKKIDKIEKQLQQLLSCIEEDE